MTDYFALLEEPRRPWLDLAALKAKFLARSAGFHPDRVHQASETEKRTAQDNYTALNAAYQCLNESRSRIRHLLELELGSKPSDLTEVPNDLMNLFFQVGKAFRAVDGFLAEKAKAKSPLLQVQFFEHGQALAETLTGLRDEITTHREAELANLREIDAHWPAHPPRPTEPLLQVWRMLSFYDRWLAQIQQRVVELTI